MDVPEQIICLHCVLSGRHVYAENIQLVVIHNYADCVRGFYVFVARNGNIRARRIKLLKGASSLELYQGVVCSLKDNYGFIERADIVKEIFFHFSEFQDDIQSLTLGDDVQYAIQTRNVSSWNGMCAVFISL